MDIASVMTTTCSIAATVLAAAFRGASAQPFFVLLFEFEVGSGGGLSVWWPCHGFLVFPPLTPLLLWCALLVRCSGITNRIAIADLRHLPGSWRWLKVLDPHHPHVPVTYGVLLL